MPQSAKWWFGSLTLQQFRQICAAFNHRTVHRIKFILVIEIPNSHFDIPVNSVTVPSGRTTFKEASAGSIVGSNFV